MLLLIFLRVAKNSHATSKQPQALAFFSFSLAVHGVSQRLERLGAIEKWTTGWTISSDVIGC
jgi:hypothetical protein